MNEIVRHHQQTSALPDRIQYAKALAESGLLPQSYRKQPANVLYAVEYGDALGVKPMTAITGIHVIQGKPTLSADLMAALIRRAGHKLRVRVEQGPVAIAQVIRADDPDFTFQCRWDMDRAKAAGLLGKDNWQNHPTAMLKARAISEVAREACSEVLNGLIYTPEELGAAVDGDGTVVDVDTAIGEIKDVGDVHAMADDYADHLAEETANALITPSQLKKIGAIMREAGIEDREDRLQYVRTVIGRDVDSSKKLTRDEASAVIDALSKDAAAHTETESTAGEVMDAEVVDGGDA